MAVSQDYVLDKSTTQPTPLLWAMLYWRDGNEVLSRLLRLNLALTEQQMPIS